MVTEVIGLTEPLVTCSDNIHIIQLPDSYLNMSNISTEIREQRMTVPLMFIVDLQKPLNSPLLHLLSPPLFVIHKRAAVDACQRCCLIYRHLRAQTVVPELQIQWELLNLSDALPCKLGVRGILILHKPVDYAEFQCYIVL